jgi:nucleoside-diphosphate-sugar epimerase
MKILVTGGAGYTGAPLCKALLDAGHRVTIVDNFMFGYDAILPIVAHPRFEVVKMDIRNEHREYLKMADVIFHLAALSGYPACEANPHSAKLININGTEAISRALSPQQFLVFASTTSFYGSSGMVSSEETPPTPISLYGITKRDGESVVMERANSVSLRWATVFGISARMRPGLLVHDFVERAVQERTIVLYDADSRRTFIHVEDLVRGYLFALDNAQRMRGQVFNMGSNELNYTKREIAAVIRERTDCDIVEARLGDTDIRNFQVTFDKVRRLGFQCRRTLAEGVDELIKLYRFYAPHSFIKTI